MSRAECYDLHLYCDAGDEVHEHPHLFPHVFNGRNQTEAYRAARCLGWHLDPKGIRDLCPSCNAKSKQGKP